MIKSKYLIISLLLISSFTYAQKKKSVEVFNGRGLFDKSDKILDLSHQNLKTVPIEANNPNLEVLILDNNLFNELPSWIGNLKNLKILSIKNNNLKEINLAIVYCENLEQLYLSGNKKLSDISSITTCNNLEIIDVVDTKIREIPMSIQTMDNLCYFKYSKEQ